jgi:hypothetical protein
MLEPVAENIWVVEGEIVDFYGFPYPTRSVIIRLNNGDLWVWSPIKLSMALKDEVDSLGPVVHLVSPNKIHHLYLADWQTAYPDSLLWGPASTIQKRDDLKFQPALKDTPPRIWEEIDQAWFQGCPVFDEVVFFHEASSTAIIADLSENFDEKFLHEHWSLWKRVIARAWKITVGWGFAPLELRWLWFDRAAGRRALDKLTGWRPQRVIMAHGEWQREGGEAFLERAFSGLR